MKINPTSTTSKPFHPAAKDNSAESRLGYSMTGAAKMLSVSCRTIARLTKAGHLHPSKALRKKIYSHADLVRFLEETSR